METTAAAQDESHYGNALKGLLWSLPVVLPVLGGVIYLIFF